MTSPTPSPEKNSRPSLVLEIDQHRNHLAILEAYQLTREMYMTCPKSSSLEPGLRRTLLRLVFFLTHTKSPVLAESDRLALIQFHQNHLADALTKAPETRLLLSSHQLQD